MSHAEPALERAALVRALVATMDRAMPACAEVAYCLVGTGAALLHGVQLPAADVDIMVEERAGVDAFAAALADCPCLVAPVWMPHAHQYYASFSVEGVGVEFSTVEIASDADYYETLGRGLWEHYTPLACGPYRVPTVALELRLITELRRDRADRYGPLMAHLRQRGCDVALVRRGLDGIGMPLARQAKVLAQLGVA